MTRLTELTLRHPSVTWLAMLGVLVAGFWTAGDLRRELIPEVAFPQATVVVVWPGVSADQVTRDLVAPIEAALESTSDVDVVEVSANASDSFAAVTVRAEYGTDQDVLRDAIQARVDTVDLPDGAGTPEVVLFSFSDLPVVQTSIRAADAGADAIALRRRVENVIVPEIEAIDGVSSVSLAGGQSEKIYLELDRAAMDAAGVTADTIRSVLAANNVRFPAGELATDGRSIPLQVSHRVTSEADLARLALAPRGGGPGAAGPADAGRSGMADARTGAGTGPAGTASTAPGAGQATAGALPGARGAEPTAAAPAPTAVAGPFPLPPALRAVGLETTDDITPELVLQLERQDPALLRRVADAVIASLPPGSAGALRRDVVAVLPADVRARLAGLAAPTAAAGGTVAGGTDGAPDGGSPDGAAPHRAPTAEPGGPPVVGPPGGARVQVVVVAEGDTLSGLAERYGVDVELIRQANGLTDDLLVAGSVVRVPLADAGDRLPGVWAAFGASRAGDVSPAILARALAERPAAVSNLTPAQLLALPPETVRLLPLPLVSRQADDVRQGLLDRMGALATGTPAPSATPAGAAALPGGSAPRLLAPVRQATAVTSESAVVTLGDVATVTRGPAPAETINRTNGRTSLSLLVFKDRSANTVAVVDDVLERLEELGETADLEGVEFNTVFEQGSFIDESLSGVRNEGILGSLLAVLVILAFLHFSVRATLVTAISIPLSIVAALLLMRGQGLTLNLLTLAGLTIAIGRVVDDAIVVIENVYRHIQRGEDRRAAVVQGTREVATAITSATLVTVAVFLPLGLVGGITREFFLPFALTATYALLASLIVAVTVVPLLALRFLTRASMPPEGETWLQRVYTPALTWALDHRWVTLALALALFAGSLSLLGVVDRTFLPSFGEPAVRVEMALPPGTALGATDAVARRVEDVLGDQADIAAVETTVGRGSQLFGQFTGADSARAFFYAGLGDEPGALERWLGEGPDPEAVAETVRERVGAARDAAVAAGEIDASTPVTFTVSVGAGGGPQGNLYDLQVLGDDAAALRDANARIMAALEDPDRWDDLGYDTVPILNLKSNLAEARQVVGVEVDPAAAIQRGLTTVQIGLALREALDGRTLGTVEIAGPGGGETLDVVAIEPNAAPETVAALADFAVAGPGGPVPLGEIAAIREQPGAVQITRVNGRRAALISGEIVGGDTFGVADDAQSIIADLDLDEDVVEVGAGVESRQQREGFRDMLIALPVSILVVYLIMVGTFGSLLHPFTILFSLPFALSGALVALAATNRPVSLSSLIGMMMLIGIVTTNAIVLVDLVQQYRARGLDAREALIRGGRTRVRPIVMTALATVIALIPLAAGFTEGALIASELATVVIGGLVSSTVLTLVIVPVIYSLLDGLSARGGVPVGPPPEGGYPSTSAVTPTPAPAPLTPAAAAAAAAATAASAAATPRSFETGEVPVVPPLPSPKPRDD